MMHVIIYLYVEISYFECINKKKLILPHKLDSSLALAKVIANHDQKIAKRKGKERLEKDK